VLTSALFYAVCRLGDDTSTKPRIEVERSRRRWPGRGSGSNGAARLERTVAPLLPGSVTRGAPHKAPGHPAHRRWRQRSASFQALFSCSLAFEWKPALQTARRTLCQGRLVTVEGRLKQHCPRLLTGGAGLTRQLAMPASRPNRRLVGTSRT
jgi:hypothetical protein